MAEAGIQPARLLRMHGRVTPCMPSIFAGACIQGSTVFLLIVPELHQPGKTQFWSINGGGSRVGYKIVRSAQDKVQMHLERMYLLLQRLKRNRNFSRPAFAGLKAGTRPYVEVRALACVPCTHNFSVSSARLHLFSAQGLLVVQHGVMLNWQLVVLQGSCTAPSAPGIKYVSPATDESTMPRSWPLWQHGAARAMACKRGAWSSPANPDPCP